MELVWEEVDETKQIIKTGEDWVCRVVIDGGKGGISSSLYFKYFDDKLVGIQVEAYAHYHDLWQGNLSLIETFILSHDKL